MDNIKKQLMALSKKISKEVSGTVSINELFSNEFMEENNILVNIDDIFTSANVDISHISDLSFEEKSQLDMVVLQYGFDSWSDFLKSAEVFYAKKKLHF